MYTLVHIHILNTNKTIYIIPFVLLSSKKIKDMLVILFLILLFSGVISSEPCHPDDIYSILAFKNSFSNGDVLLPWSSDMDCCLTFTCKNNRVIVLFITNSQLSGSLKPDAFAGFTFLRETNTSQTAPSCR